LIPSNAVFSTLQQDAKGHHEAEAWFAEKAQQRKDHPLLRYLLQRARNADEHGVPSATALDRQKIDTIERGDVLLADRA
jgi:hypothetical protein